MMSPELHAMMKSRNIGNQAPSDLGLFTRCMFQGCERSRSPTILGTRLLLHLGKMQQ